MTRDDPNLNLRTAVIDKLKTELSFQTLFENSGLKGA